MKNENFDYTIDWNGGTPDFEPGTPALTELYQGDTVTVLLSGFTSPTEKIDKVTFYSSASKGSSNEVGEWTRSGGNGPSLNNKFNVVASGVNAVINDTNPVASAVYEDYWFSVTGTSGWIADPALRVKPGSRP